MRRRTKTIKKGRNYSIQSWRGIKGKNTEFILNVILMDIDIKDGWTTELINILGGDGISMPSELAWRYETKEEVEQALSIAKLKGLL